MVKMMIILHRLLNFWGICRIFESLEGGSLGISLRIGVCGFFFASPLIFVAVTCSVPFVRFFIALFLPYGVVASFFSSWLFPFARHLMQCVLTFVLFVGDLRRITKLKPWPLE